MATRKNFTGGCHGRKEGAIFFPLGALTILTVITFVVIVGLRSIFIKQNAALFRLRANQVCANLIQYKEVVSRSDAVSIFQNLALGQFGLFDPDHVVLQKAELVLPHLMGVGSFDPYNLHETGYFQSASTQVHTNPAIFVTEGVDTARFLTQWQKTAEYGGQLVGCSFEGRIKFLDNFIPWGTRDEQGTEVVAAYAYSIPVRGYFPDHDPTAPNSSDFPGITIAVSTHMTTSRTRSKFVFDWNRSYTPAYDPADEYYLSDYIGPSATSVVATPNFTAAPVLPAAPVVGGLIMPDPVGPREDPPESYWNGTFTEEVNPVNQYDDFATACMNPLVLVRNAFLRTFVELAARHGQLRRSTEIVHIGTHDRNVGTVDVLPTTVARPTVIVPYTQDLLNASYQIPFVTFNGGRYNPDPAVDGINKWVDSPWAFGLPTQGPVKPFAANTNQWVTDDWRKFQSLVAGQLRSCYHLYRCQAGASSCSFPWIQPVFPHGPDPEGSPGFINLRLFDGYFEGQESYNPREATLMDASSKSWEQSSNDGLRATDLVSMLGSTQLCPYEGPVIPGEGTDACLKPEGSFPSYDLRPDYRGLVQYLSNSYKAFASPGLFAPGLGCAAICRQYGRACPDRDSSGAKQRRSGFH